MDLTNNKDLITNIIKVVLNKVSYILVWSNTNTMHRHDSKSYSVDEEVNQKLLRHTLDLIDQILEMNPHEILVMDNEGNFPKHDNQLVKVILSYQSAGYFEGLPISQSRVQNRPSWLNEINIEDYVEDVDFNAAKSTAMAYNHGIIESSGDYLVLQHNDTLYLDNVIEEQIELLEKENYEYITVDKKPVKFKELEKYEYFADCYWFLCRRDFYSKHNIWVDWIKGDNNHLATITCHDKGLRYLHLPGFYENDETNKWDFFKKYNYNTNEGNLHTFNNKPFLIHRKGGTGLYRVMEKKR